MVDSLQSVLVPRALPDTEGLGFAARYRVGDRRNDVGGDFYDAFEIGDDEWGVMVGDVCGKGPDAAALTGLVRHSIRAAVVRDSRPIQVLSQTNDAVVGQIDDFRFCTATYMSVRRTTEGASVVVSSAGHPRPVVVRADGRTEMLDCSGVLLGVVRSPSLVEARLDLFPGDAVVLYTDGVTEARGEGGLFGDERLVAVLAGAAGGTADEIASALDDAVRAHHRGGEDDLAIVVVQATAAAGGPAPATPV
jgi:sigma-B regulation protein RsbU (phosphoserine phosphatase)